ncbi:GA module-containing protein, partial [Gemelliphila asaccharolytica]
KEKDTEALTNAKTKALADLAKFDNLSKDEKDSFKAEINKANSIDEVQTVSAKAQLKNVTKTAEAKDTALEELDKLANLTDEQKNNLKAKIYSANSVAEVNTALDQAIAKNTANKEAKEKKELANAKTKAKAEIDKLDDVSKEDKDNLKAVIDKINSIEEFNKFFNKVKEKAKEDIDKFDNLSKEEKDNLKSEIVKAKNAKEFNDTLAKAKAKNTANKAKEELKLIIEKKFQDPQQKAAVLKDLEKLKTLKEVEQLKADIEGSVIIGEHNDKKLAEVKAKALAEIDKLDDVS